MKVVYIALDPLKYPRIKKIAYSIRKVSDVQFDIMIPKVRFVWRGGKIGRLLFATVNYLVTLLQILFIKADFFWVANCPDILVLPLVLRRKRYILEYRSPWSIEVENEFGQGPWVHLSVIIENIALRHASVITLTTSRLIMKVRRFRKLVFVIPNYPLRSFRATVPREEFRRQHNVRGDEGVVLFVGRLSRVEGADLLPDIMARVWERTNAVFWIVGDGPFYPLLEKFEKKFPNRVRLFGWRPHEQIPNFINAADVCITPRHTSSYSQFYNEEGLHKISEYMFFGKPIIACGIGESKEYLLVKEGEMVEGIVKALRGEAPLPTPRTWEDYSEKKILEMFSLLFSKSF